MAPPKKRRGRPPKVQPIEQTSNPVNEALDAKATELIDAAADGAKKLIALCFADNDTFGEGYQKVVGAFTRAANIYYDAMLGFVNSPGQRDVADAHVAQEVRADVARVKLVETVGGCIASLTTTHGIGESTALQIVSAIFGIGQVGGIETSPIDIIAPKALDLIMQAISPKNGATGSMNGALPSPTSSNPD